MTPPLARSLPNGRLHLQHGPIDLVVEAVGLSPPPSQVGPARLGHPTESNSARAEFDGEGDRPKGGGGGLALSAERRPPPPCSAWSPSPCGGGEETDVARAYRAAVRRFATILPELCDELPALRSPTRAGRLRGVVARRMEAATLPYAPETFVTPMAAVAGAVADAVLAAMLELPDLRRASVNNGGDIALHLAPGESVTVGLVDRPDRLSLFGTTVIEAADGIGGIATSGWRGRSFSLGIADAVTILAETAAEADAAATIVANAVDLPGHPAVARVPAHDVQADSDLGARLVTRGVGPLSRREIEAALGAGLAKAEELALRGLIRGAALHLQGTTMTTRLATSPRRRHAEEAGDAGRLEARATRGACFETRPFGALLSMTLPENDGGVAREVA